MSLMANVYNTYIFDTWFLQICQLSDEKGQNQSNNGKEKHTGTVFQRRRREKYILVFFRSMSLKEGTVQRGPVLKGPVPLLQTSSYFYPISWAQTQCCDTQVKIRVSEQLTVSRLF